MPKILIETMIFQPKILEKSNDGIMRISGVFQLADTKNANGRVYPRKVWEKVLSEGSPVVDKFKGRAMLGHLEHPKDGVTDLMHGAILTTNLSLTDKGQIIGEAEILDTPDGKIAQEYINKNIRIGISSRGSGSVGANGMVAEDYKLETFDLVYNPSTPGANPARTESTEDEPVTVVEESKEKETKMSNPVTMLQSIERDVTPLLEQDTKGLLPYHVSEINMKLLEASVNLGTLVKDHPELAGASSSLQERVNTKRNALHNQEDLSEKEDEKDELDTLLESMDDDLPDLLADEEEESDEDETDPVDEAIEEIQEQEAFESVMSSAADEIRELRESLVAAEALQVATAAKLAETESQLSAAKTLILEAVDNDRAEEVAEAIKAVLKEDAKMEGVVDLLAECLSADEVFKRAAAISGAKDEDDDVEEDDDQDLGDLLSEDADEEESEEDADDVEEVDDEEVDESSSVASSLFEDWEGDLDEDLSSEDDVSTGLLETAQDKELKEHKGRNLCIQAVSRIQG